MIISASYKTDIPAFYSDWFNNRLKAGFCKIVNPYNQRIIHVSLKSEDVQAFVFWSRNYQNFLDKEILKKINHPFICHMSITGYPRILDQATISPKRAIEQLWKMREEFSQRCLVWRYDPIVMSEQLDVTWHLENFSKIAQKLEGCVDEAIVSFVQFYKKTQWNLKNKGFEAHYPSKLYKQELLGHLHQKAQQHGIELSLCAQPELLTSDVKESACIDLIRLNELAGHDLHVKKRPHRKECGCVSSRDIGEYNTCPHGCLYCYAVEKKDLAKQRFQNHDPDSPFLFPPVITVETQDEQGILL